MSKLERLLNLTAALLETRRPLTRDEIHQRVPGYPDSEVAFRRAFERDKDDLREMGIPLSVLPIEGYDPPRDGYRIRRDDYYLQDPGLEPDELAALHLACSAVRLEGADGLEALWKLGGLVREDPDDVPPLTALPSPPHLGEVFRGISEDRLVRFSYRGERREVVPYRLDFRRGRWYLTGFDHHRDAERNFRLDRIDGALELGEEVGSQARVRSARAPDTPPWELGEGDTVETTVLVDADQAHWAVGHLRETEAHVDERPDGSVALRLRVTNREAFRSFVLTFLEHAEVLEPEELRRDLISWLEGIAS